MTTTTRSRLDVPLLAPRLLAGLVLAGALAVPACSKSSSKNGEKGPEAVKEVSAKLVSGTYSIKNSKSQKCLEVDDWSTTNNANVVQGTCDAANEAHQRWVVTNLGGGEYSIINEHSGKSLDVNANPCAVEVFTDSSSGGTPECFGLGDHNSVSNNDAISSYEIQPGFRVRFFEHANLSGSQITKPSMMLHDGVEEDIDPSFNDIVSSLRVMGNVRQWDYEGGSHQKFTLGGAGPYQVKPSLAATHCLDINGGSTDDGANVQAWFCNGALAQDFTFTSVSGSSANVGSPTLDDGFDTLDTAVWEMRDDTMAGESACRALPSEVGVNSGKLWLRAESVDVEGDEDNVVDSRTCASGELRSKSTYGPYGDIEFNMDVQTATGTNPEGTTGFVASMFTGSLVDAGIPGVAADLSLRNIGVELTGLALQQVDTILITNNASKCTTFHECNDNFLATVSPATDGTFSVASAHTYKVEWRWHSIKYYVDGSLVHTVRRPSRTAPWADDASRLFLAFALPNHEIETTYGGVWTDDEIPTGAPYLESHVDFIKFSPCTGPDCSLPGAGVKRSRLEAENAETGGGCGGDLEGSTCGAGETEADPCNACDVHKHPTTDQQWIAPFKDGNTLCWQNVNMNGVTGADLAYSNGEDPGDTVTVTYQGNSLGTMTIQNTGGWPQDGPTATASISFAAQSGFGEVCIVGADANPTQSNIDWVCTPDFLEVY